MTAICTPRMIATCTQAVTAILHTSDDRYLEASDDNNLHTRHLHTSDDRYLQASDDNHLHTRYLHTSDDRYLQASDDNNLHTPSALLFFHAQFSNAFTCTEFPTRGLSNKCVLNSMCVCVRHVYLCVCMDASMNAIMYDACDKKQSDSRWAWQYIQAQWMHAQWIHAQVLPYIYMKLACRIA